MTGAHIDPPPQFNAAHAARWRDTDAARSYRNRAPYPPETFDILEALIVDAPRVVLDIGCGTGAIARAMAPRAAQIDAIDLAAEMLEEARLAPGGDARNIAWRAAAAENAYLTPPYALIVGGQSLHWMAWEIVLPRFARALTPGGVLAIVTVEDIAPAPWRAALTDIIVRHSTAKHYVPFDMLPIWEDAGLYRPLGQTMTAPFDFTQSLDDFIDGHHAMSTLTRAHIDAPAFDAQVRALLAPHCPDGVLTRAIRGQVNWGKPLEG